MTLIQLFSIILVILMWLNNKVGVNFKFYSLSIFVFLLSVLQFIRGEIFVSGHIVMKSDKSKFFNGMITFHIILSAFFLFFSIN